jgi:hypothetical protein
MKTCMLVALLLLVSGQALAESEYALSPAERKNLNTFFSNFSEASMKSFPQGGLSQEAMLDFGLRHAYLNKFKSLKRAKDGQNVLVPAELVDRASINYFNAKLKKHAKAEYPVPMADGEAYVFSQISKLTDLGDYVYRAEGIIYYTGSGDAADPHSTPAQWKKAGNEVEILGSFTGKIQAVDERYVLLEYTVVNKKP